MNKKILTQRIALLVALVNGLEPLKAQGRAAVFDLMLHSSHRQFMRFLREHGEC